MAVFVSPARTRFGEKVPYDYPFGGKLRRNVLEQYHGPQENVKILFLGCHDLRNVLETVGSKSNGTAQHLSIHLNHLSPLSFARNILILQVVSSPSFDVNNQEDMSYLWDLWYNLQWPQSTCRRFVKDVKSLLEAGFHSDKHFILNKSHDDDLTDILVHWGYAITMELHLPTKINEILNYREQFMKKVGCNLFPGKDNLRNARGSLKRFAVWRNSAMETKGFTKGLKKKLSRETSSYFETGTCSLSATETYALNPTLFEPKTFNWRVDVSSCPFDTYLPLNLKELDTSAQDGIATRYCQKMLAVIVEEYRRRKENIDFQLYLSDDLKFSLLDCEEKFDVIDCSALADEVGLANLIVSASQKLEAHLHALLITESFQWGTVASTVALYLEESLCAPLSMIPTIYGLRVANQVELGRTSFIEIDYPAGFPPITLHWRQAQRFVNVLLNNSPHLKIFVNKLANRCFFNEDDRKLREEENCGLKCYTPLTFSSIVANFAEVVKEDVGQQKEIASQFALAQQTLKNWAAGHPVILLMATLPFTPLIDQFLQCQILPGASWLRLVLVPSDHFANYKKQKRKNVKVDFNWAFEIPKSHYVDNFDLHCTKDGNGSFISMQVSFLLPKKHDLEKTHCGIIVDLLTGRTLLIIGDIKDMQQKRYEIPHPSSKHLRHIEAPSKCHVLKVNECQESESHFVINIAIPHNLSTKGLKISTNHVLPCLSAHCMSFCYSDDVSVPRLNLWFPHPVLCDGISVHHFSKFIEVLVEKALYEPWPSDFEEQSKWNVEELAPFPLIDSTDNSCAISHHTNEGQYDRKAFRQLQDAKIRKSEPSFTAIEDVRRIVLSFFPLVKIGYDYLTILDADNNTVLWHILVHRPFVTSPLGVPMLLITAVDLEMLRKHRNSSLGENQVEKDHQRIFGVHKKVIVRLPMLTEEGVGVFRHFLRTNSIKMHPTKWQKENLPTLDYSPFLATFLSPLYLDNQHSWDMNEFEVLRKEGIHSCLISPDYLASGLLAGRCSGCGVYCAKLNRCTNCTLAYYCTEQCQRNDWKKHRDMCGPVDC